jgi:Uma2 family endonuclease
MSTTIVPIAHYLHETWQPDREYVDGEVLERSMGEKDHAAWQAALLRVLSAWRQSANIKVFAELRLQIAPTRFRVPDILVIDRNAADEQIITHPPLLCVEILSPEDRIGRMEARIQEYLDFGIRAVWLIDPQTRTAYQCAGGSIRDWKAVETLTVRETAIRIEVKDVLADLD